MRTLTSTILFCLCFPGVRLSAQSAGCDGVRYKSPVFSGVSKTTVTYGSNKDVLNQTISLQMDVYQPNADLLDKRPAIVLAHGGSFIFGNKSDIQGYAELFAKHGFVAVSIQYRLYPLFPLGYPDSLDIMDAAIKALGDMKAAVRYLREDAATANLYKIDPDNIFVGGYSAGAVAALHVAMMDETDPIPVFAQTAIAQNGGINGNTGSPSNQTYSSAVKAVISMSGGLYKSGFIDADDPPVTSIHGTADDVVPFEYGLAANIMSLEGSARVHQAATTASIYNYLEIVDGGDHVNMYSPSSPHAPKVAAFFEKSAEMLYNCVCAASPATEPAPASQNPLRVMPNPFRDVIKVDLEPLGASSATLGVYDLFGRRLLLLSDVASLQPVDLGALKPGVYVLRVEDRLASVVLVKE